jgi:hypothetical protein
VLRQGFSPVYSFFGGLRRMERSLERDALPREVLVYLE